MDHYSRSSIHYTSAVNVPLIPQTEAESRKCEVACFGTIGLFTAFDSSYAIQTCMDGETRMIRMENITRIAVSVVSSNSCINITKIKATQRILMDHNCT